MAIMNKNTPPVIRLNLKQILDERDITPDDVVTLAEREGYDITRTTVYNMMSKKAAGVHFRSLAAVCVALKVKPGDLFTLE